MPRPTTKSELIAAANAGFAKLDTLFAPLPEAARHAVFAFEDRDKNLRDVLIHLYEWHQLLLNWIRNNRAGRAVNFLPDPYNWKTYPQMNIAFWEKHRSTPLTEAETMLQKSHAEVLSEIDTFTDEQLFTKKHFPWTGTTHLASYCISATSSHYDWAMKKLKQHIKSWK